MHGNCDFLAFKRIYLVDKQHVQHTTPLTSLQDVDTMSTEFLGQTDLTETINMRNLP